MNLFMEKVTNETYFHYKGLLQAKVFGFGLYLVLLYIKTVTVHINNEGKS